MTISGAGSALVAVCAREDVTGVADAMTVGLTRNGTAARPLGAGVTTSGLTMIR